MRLVLVSLGLTSLVPACRSRASHERAVTEAALGGAARARAEGPSQAAPAGPARSLAEARRGFHTRVIDRSARSGPAPTPPPSVFTLVRYAAPGGTLPAYVTPRPMDGKRRPALIWIPGGFDPSIDKSAWTRGYLDEQSGLAFRQAGAVLMIPARRGGNDDPRPRETLFGEVDDVLAAADYVAKLDYVDPARIYLGGHSTGGTLALLVAESTDRFRGVFSFGPVGDITSYGANVTFDPSDETEARLRSPMFFLSAIRTPTLIFEGEVPPSNAGALPYLTPAITAVPVRAFRVAGVSHFSVLAPITQLLAQKLMQRAASVEVTAVEIRRAVGNATPRSLVPGEVAR